MKILNASQLSDLDQYTCEEQNINSWQLMERASGLAYKEIKSHLNSEEQHITVFAGPGNNGGDGLAIAFFLAKDAHKVTVYLVNYTSSRTEDNQKNLDRLQKQAKCEIIDLNAESELPIFNDSELLIDAIFGVGLNRPMPEFVQKLVQKTNKTKAKLISIDVPSGMYLEKSLSEGEEVFQSDVILTFQTPKLPFFLPDYSRFVGEITVIDIGLSQKRLKEISSETDHPENASGFNLVDLKLVKTLYHPRKRFSHKGTNGHAVLVGGSRYMLGSILLAAKSCMRSGVGKTSVMMPSFGHLALLQELPEAMLIEHTSSDYISFKDLDFKPDAVGVGVGIGKSKDALNALISWLEAATCPLVIDADALNLISEHKALQQKIPKKSILTPHPGELKRLVGSWKDDFDKIKKIKDFSTKLDVIIVAKDAYTLCVYKNKVFINSTGNAGMATAGSGDVLTGLVTGLLAQNYTSLEASLLGVFFHGLAGDIGSKTTSEESLIASDIVNNLGYSFLNLQD